MADLQLAVAVKPESYVKRPVALGIFEMSMHSLPRVGFRTGSSTEVPATCRVALVGSTPALFSMADTRRTPMSWHPVATRGVRGRGIRRIAADAMPRLSHGHVRRRIHAVRRGGGGPPGRNDDGRLSAAVGTSTAAGGYLA